MKKILPVAVLAALAGVNGAQAVHVNPDGLGQVLLYPYYSTEGDNDTYISLVNTTSDYKAVKIRILESMNSNEVLDFNIYMSPYDHWSAVITSAQDEASIDVAGATIRSADTSCTVPLAVSQGQTIPFRDFVYADDSENGLDRTQEGYVEVIEMGIITDSTLQAAIKHGSYTDADGNPEWRPGDCAYLDAQWRDGGDWDDDNDYGMSGVTGGLYGYGVLIDVPRGAGAGYDAVALDNWGESIVTSYHTNSGFVVPTIGSGSSDYAVFDEGGVVEGTASNGWDAVSAILMQGRVSNDYVLEPSINAGTDWVVTFPTKRQYVNQGTVAEAPFTDAWDDETSTACESFKIRYWDREEREPTTPIDPTDFSPLPPPDKPQELSFCAEANVLTFNNSNVLSASARTGYNVTLEDGFTNGWARLDFAADESGHMLDAGANTFYGLPSVGFAVQRYLNGDIKDGVIGNYGVAIKHKGDIIVGSSVN